MSKPAVELACKCGDHESFHSEKKLRAIFKNYSNIDYALKKSLRKHKFEPMICKTCGKGLDLTLCEYGYKRNYFCREHCPKHHWQSDYDWPTECKHCGIHYGKYLEGLLKQNDIKFDKYQK